jgi:hypothetical protein
MTQSSQGGRSAEHDDGLERLHTANLARVIDWVKFAETKNAGLLTFSSAWLIALATFLTSEKDRPLIAIYAAGAALPMFALGAFFAFAAFMPKTKLEEFFRPSPELDSSTTNYTFWGHLAGLSPDAASKTIAGRYRVPKGEKSSGALLDDLASQAVINAIIAKRKFELFDYGATCVLIGFAIITLMAGVGFVWSWSNAA